MSCKIAAPPHWSSSRTPLGSTKWPNHHKYTKITPPEILYLPSIDNVTSVTTIFESPFLDKNAVLVEKLKLYKLCILDGK